MTKIIIEKNAEGVENATAIVKFELGEVYRNEVSKDGKKRTVIAGMAVNGMVDFYKQLVFEKAKNNDWEEYKETLEQYSTLLLLQTIGVEHSPLKFDEDGDIEGLDYKRVEIEFK